MKRTGDMEKVRKDIIYKDRYRILRKIGEGGAGKVYMAIDESDGRAVTIKFLKGDCLRSSGKQSAYGEAAILEKLDHIAIPKVIEAYEDCFILEYIPGNSLDKVIKNKGKLSEKEAVRIVKEILDILGYLHGRTEPVIYRDLKPSNIVLKPDGHVSLIDFGASREYRQGDEADTSNLGTFGFAAPEQFGNLGQTDPRTDIYCLGKTLEQIIRRRPTPELGVIIDKCTRPDRDDRFTSCREIEEALDNCPAKILRRRIMHFIKLSFMAAAAAVLIAFTASHFESVRSYAAYDARTRIPAVRTRLGYARIRIKGLVMDRLGIDIDEEIPAIEFFRDEYIETKR